MVPLIEAGYVVEHSTDLSAVGTT